MTRLSISDQRIRSFRRRLLTFYRQHRRDLPWRNTTDPYKITVAEIMLQQTQVDRVIPKYLAWISRWPTWKSLAQATNRELLAAWSGLGYNRRALFLGQMARIITDELHGCLPDHPDELRKLPGIGPYTAKAILIFAFNQPLATIDTNIRRVLLYEFGLPVSTPAADLEALALRLVPKKRSRNWHNALMDYSRMALPRRMVEIPPASRQSKFEGSLRQIRGEIIRQLVSRHSITADRLAKLTTRSEADVASAIEAMVREGVINRRGNRLTLVEH